jgi:DNA-binding protein H-NS
MVWRYLILPKPTHRSKKERKLTWSGRGSEPRWMRAEMKALKLKPDAFKIKT